MGFKCGIVGLPNVGKSTLFNALTDTASAEAANYPFCTIDPNIGKVSVPDDRLNKLAKIAASKDIIFTQLEFVDIAGLVEGASHGEGLGNQFLSHIREVDAIIYLLRCFDDDDITHVTGSVDPLRDQEIIDTELMLADLASIEKRLPALEKKAKSQDKEAKQLLDLLLKIQQHLSQGKAVRSFATDDTTQNRIQQLHLLTAKPALYMCNVGENDLLEGNHYCMKVIDAFGADHVGIISAQIESDIASIPDQQERTAFLESIGLKKSGLSRMIRDGYALLNLITFFTVGPKESKAWTVHKGAFAPEAAGAIHSDFEKGFIRAETISYEDYLLYNGEQGAKEKGKLRLEGKDYIVKDGDVLHFRFNV